MKYDVKSSSQICDVYSYRLKTVQSLSFYHHCSKGYIEIHIHTHLKLNTYSHTCNIIANNRFEI